MKKFIFFITFIISAFSAFSESISFESISESEFIKKVQNGKVLRFEIPQNAKNKIATLEIPIDLSNFSDKFIALEGMAREIDLNKDKSPYPPVIFKLEIMRANGKKDICRNKIKMENIGWNHLATATRVPTEPIKSAKIVLGFQRATGAMEFQDVKILELDTGLKDKSILAKKCDYSDALKAMPILRGFMSPDHKFVREEDYRDMAAWGANIVRFQIGRNIGKKNTELDTAEYSQWIDFCIKQASKALDYAKKYNLKIIVDLHTLPGGRTTSSQNRMIFEKKYLDLYIEMWEKIATRLKGHPALFGYDLFNEPVQIQNSAVSSALDSQYRAALAIRKIDPTIPIIVEVNIVRSGLWTPLEPLPLKDIIYSLHFYSPSEYSHQFVGMTRGEKYDKNKLKPYTYKQSDLEAYIEDLINFQKKYGARIYIGEFSVARWAPDGDKYLEDAIQIFEKHGWDWTYHAFREAPVWSLEHSEDYNIKTRTKNDTARKRVLLKYLKRNSTQK